jgi:hypothetical protein
VELTGPYLVACLLLVAAGLAKAARPGDTARAVARVVPVPVRWLGGAVRAGAVAEAGLGVVAALHPRPVAAWLVAASYAGFATFVEVVRRRGGPLATCGCFGRADTPATRLHVAVDAALAATAVAVAVVGPTGWLVPALAGQPARGVPLVLLGVLGAWLCGLVLSRLGRVAAARRTLGIVRGAVS